MRKLDQQKERIEFGKRLAEIIVKRKLYLVQEAEGRSNQKIWLLMNDLRNFAISGPQREQIFSAVFTKVKKDQEQNKTVGKELASAGRY